MFFPEFFHQWLILQIRFSLCACYLGNDIGAYNSCPHMCKYCYANYDEKSVRLNRINHNPKSAFLIGDDMPNDKVHKAVQKSWINGQISLNEFLI